MATAEVLNNVRSGSIDRWNKTWKLTVFSGSKTYSISHLLFLRGLKGTVDPALACCFSLLIYTAKRGKADLMPCRNLMIILSAVTSLCFPWKHCCSSCSHLNHSDCIVRPQAPLYEPQLKWANVSA